MMAMPCRPRSPLTSTASPGRPGRGEMSIPGGTRPMPAVLMKMPSPLPRSTTLVSPVTICDARRVGRRAHRRHDAAERLHGQPLFQDEARAEVKRPRPGHRQVVDGPVDRQRADVAAGKEERADDERVGGEGQAGAADLDHGAVVRRPSRRRPPANAGRNSPSISPRIRRPPPPWAICTVAASSSGSGQLKLNTSGRSSLMPFLTPQIPNPQIPKSLNPKSPNHPKSLNPSSPPISVIGGAGPFGRDHRGAQRPLGRATDAEGRAIVGLGMALQTPRPRCTRPARRPRWPRRRNVARRRSAA